MTFGIDVEYPKEEISMMDYTWVIDQVKTPVSIENCMRRS